MALNTDHILIARLPRANKMSINSALKCTLGLPPYFQSCLSLSWFWMLPINTLFLPLEACIVLLSFFHSRNKSQHQTESPNASVTTSTEREESMLIRADHQVVKTKTLLSVERVKNTNQKYRKSLIFLYVIWCNQTESRK